MPTIGDVITEAQGVINEVSGPGTQRFTEDIMMKGVIRSFDMLFTKYGWEQYIEWVTLALDGVAGKVTTAGFTNVRVENNEDILSVHRAGFNQALPSMVRGINPNTMSGTTPEAWKAMPVSDSDYTDKRILIYPITATGSIDVCKRIYPAQTASPFTTDTVLYIDKSLLAYGAAFMQLMGDETNPAAAMVAQKLMEARFNQITSALANRPLAIRGRAGVVSDWFTRP